VRDCSGNPFAFFAQKIVRRGERKAQPRSVIPLAGARQNRNDTYIKTKSPAINGACWLSKNQKPGEVFSCPYTNS